MGCREYACSRRTRRHKRSSLSRCSLWRRRGEAGVPPLLGVRRSRAHPRPKFFFFFVFFTLVTGPKRSLSLDLSDTRVYASQMRTTQICLSIFVVVMKGQGGAARMAPITYAPQTLQGNLAHKKHPPPRTLHQDYASGHMVVLWGGSFLRARCPCSESSVTTRPADASWCSEFISQNVFTNQF